MNEPEPAEARAGRSGRVGLVTGAASGIGAAVTARLRAGGLRVGGLDLNESSEVDVTLVSDASDREAVSEAVARLESELGPVEVLVTCAGHYEMAPLAEIDDQRWARMLGVHLGGVVNATAAVLPGMLERRRGTIVAISSELALAGGDGDAHYAAAKGAIVGFTRSLAVEVAARGVRVNAIAPGATDTPLLGRDSPWRGREYIDGLPLRRIVEPAEVAEVVGFLIEDGDFYVGQVLSPNAGAVI